MRPVPSLAATRQGSVVTLRWLPPPEVGSTYYIYRSTSGLDGFTQPLGQTTATAFTDAGAPSGTLLYQVRASRLVTSGSGTYWDLSQGAFVETQ